MPRPRSALHSGQGPALPCSHPTRLETCSGSLTFLLSAAAIRRKRLPGKLVGSDHEHAVRLLVWDIDDPQVSTRNCLAKAILEPSRPARSSPGFSRTSMTSSSATLRLRALRCELTGHKKRWPAPQSATPPSPS